MVQLPLDDLIDRIKSLPDDMAKRQMKAYLQSFVGDPKKGDILRNRYKREMLAKVKKLS